MTALQPHLRIREATQADALAMADIQFAAFGTDIIDQLLFPGGITEDARAKLAHSLFSRPSPDQGAESLLVVAELDGSSDSKPTEMIAFAKWCLRRQPLPKELNVEPPVLSDMLGEGGNIEVYRWFHHALHKRMRELSQGEPMLQLEVLVCSPHRQRLGAGSALVRWGTDLADSLGLVSWLESSPSGYPLYKRFGYKPEDIDVVHFKATKTWGVTKPEDRDWGENSALEIAGPLGEGELRQVFMKRLSKTT